MGEINWKKKLLTNFNHKDRLEMRGEDMKRIGIIVLIIILAQSSMVLAVMPNNNPMLRDIKIEGKSIEPKFEMFTTEYVITVGEDVEKIEIEAIPDDEKAKVEIKGDTTLKSGRNEFEIQVTAEDGEAKKSYFVFVTKGDSKQANANLKELKIDKVEMAPVFNKDTIHYALEYPEDLEQLKIEAVPEDEEAKVEIKGNENLKETIGNIEIQVTAKDEQTIKTYYIVAKKAGIELESLEGEEPEREEQTGENTNTTVSIIVIILVMVAIVFGGKLVIERGRKKHEK